jgi:prevent-host-death family protein
MRAHCRKTPHLADSPSNSLKNIDRSEPQCAAFYLALLIGVTSPTPRSTSNAPSASESRRPHRDCRKELFRPKWRKGSPRDSAMKTMSAREAKNGFGLMIDTARAEPVLIEKHGRGVVVVVSVEEYERLSTQSGRADKGDTWPKGASKGGQ